jgi:regulator of protease activity HflC (stomatin/prohibitin superfamily)
MKQFTKQQRTKQFEGNKMNAFTQRNNPIKTPIKTQINGAKMKKLAIGVGITLATIAVGSQFFLTVQKGHVGVESKMGGMIVLDKHYSEGLHFPVNPLSSFVEISVKDESIPLKGIEIDRVGNAYSNGSYVLQTADQMTTGVDVEILLQLKPKFAPYFVQQVGTFDGAVGTYITPALLESLMKQGSSVESAQDLFSTTAKHNLKTGTMKDMVSYLQNPEIMGKLSNGFTIKDVKYQRMVLPPRIQEMINQAKEREEAEDIAVSNETIRKTDADAKLYEEQKHALATEAQADAEAHRRTVNATAVEKEADAKLYAMQKESAGIKNLNSSINPQYIQYMNAQAAVTAAQNYKGGVPQSVTTLGDANNFIPFMNMK